MRILSIETSCDETGISVLEYNEDTRVVEILGNALSSQIEIHANYGGVFPALAKRAHAEKITLLIEQALDEAELLDAVDAPRELVPEKLAFLDTKETTLKEHIAPFLTYYEKPAIDYIAVTVGPGLEPALWVGVNTARALSMIWGIPVIPINHMEGHIVTAAITELSQIENFSGPRVAPLNQTQKNPLSVQLPKIYKIQNLSFPTLALLVSGGHTELVVADSFGMYTKIGMTRDDAVGEAFDKVARMLGLPYPGGPAISKLAATFRETKQSNPFTLPRPMLHSTDYDFSFSGIKTATLYAIRDLGRELTEDDRAALACAFEDAVIEVLIHKTVRALQEYHTPTLIVGGGVAGNTYLRAELMKRIAKEFPETVLYFPEQWLATDNAIMIGLAAIAQIQSGIINTQPVETLVADGNLSIAKTS